MAKYTRTNRRYRRRNNRRGLNYRSRYRYRNKMDVINKCIVTNPGAIVPDQLYTKMHWSDNVSTFIIGSGLTAGNLVYRANSPFNVSPSSGDVSATGYSELSQLYRKYRVTFMKIQVYFTSTSPEPISVVIWPSEVQLPTNPSLSTVLQGKNNPYAKFAVISAQGGMDRCKLTNAMSIKKFVGSNEAKYDDNHASLNNTTPTETIFWNVAAYFVDRVTTSTSTANVNVDVKVTWYVQWYNRQNLVQSS